MSVLSDREIRRDVKIVPFAEGERRPGVVSFGVTSYGYDVRVGSKFKIFTNVHSVVVDPKHFDEQSFVDYEGDCCIIRRTASRSRRRSNTSKFRATCWPSAWANRPMHAAESSSTLPRLSPNGGGPGDD